MRQFKVLIFSIIILLSMLACSIGGSTNEVEKLKSTIEFLKNTIEPGIQDQVETLLPGQTSQPDNPSTNGTNPKLLEMIGQHGGSTSAMVIDSGIAFIGQGPRVVAVDVSTADQPKVLGETEVLTGLVEGIRQDGKTLYAVTLYGGIHSINAADPKKMILLDSYLPKSPGCFSIEIQNNYAYITCGSAGLFVIDISDPGNLREVGNIGQQEEVRIIHIIGNYAYIVDLNNKAMLTYDISNPMLPMKTGTFTIAEIPGDTHGAYSFTSVTNCGKYLCIGGSQAGLVVLNLDDPAQPFFAGRFEPTYSNDGMASVNNLVYLVDYMEGIFVLDVSNPENIKQVGMMPIELGDWEMRSTTMFERPVVINEGRLYTADTVYGITIIDASNPAALKRIGYYQTPASGELFAVQVKDDYAYIIGSSGFRVLNIADPGRITEIAYDVSRKDLYSQSPSGLVVQNGFAYISDSNYPFHMYDISNPEKPVQTGAVFDHASSDGAFDIVVSGDYAYLSGWGLKDAFYPGQGLWVIDISSPNDPKAVQFVDVPNEHWHLVLKDNYLFALDGGADEKDKDEVSLRVFDISNPTLPVEVAKLPVPYTPLMPTDITVAGEHLYISLSVQGILDYDISNPLQPVQLDNLQGSFTAPDSDLVWSDPYLINGGRMIYDLSDTDYPKLDSTTTLIPVWSGVVVGDKLFVVTTWQGLYIYQLK